MPSRKYKCKNVAGGCEHAIAHDIIEIGEGADFECPLSGCEAEEITGRSEQATGWTVWKKAGVALALLVVLSVLGRGTAMLLHKLPDSPAAPGVNPESRPRSQAAQACDDQAASPDDSSRWAKGVADSDIVPALATQQCAAAVSEFPKEARFHFQLGRALEAGGGAAEARKSYETAAGMGYCPAKFYLGAMTYHQALSDNDEDELTAAGQLFQQAKDCGFGPAAEVLEKLTFNADDYGNPKVMEKLFYGHIDELNEARLLVALYCRGIHDYVSMEFHPADQDCPGKLAEPTITFDLEKAALGDPRSILERLPYDWFVNMLGGGIGALIDPVWKSDPEKYKKYITSLGARDMTIMIKKYGCLGRVTEQLYGQVVVFARAGKPFWDYKETFLSKSQELFGDQLAPKTPPSQ